jgi:integrase
MGKHTNHILRDSEVKAAKPLVKVFALRDGGGLYLRVRPNGAKTWLFNYTTPPPKKRLQISLGSYPTVSLRSARDRAEECRDNLVQGIDPRNVRLQKEQSILHKQTNTLSVVAKQWFDVKCDQVEATTGRPKMSLMTSKKAWRAIELHLLPVLGDIPIEDISPPQVADMLRAIQKEGKYEIADRARTRLNEIMDFGVNSGIIKYNPLINLKSAVGSRKAIHRKAIEPEELPKLMQDIRLANVTMKIRLLLLWQLHTMVRPIEAAHARWDEIDLDKKLWTIPVERMKMRKEHKVPLTNASLAILADAKALNPHSPFVFPSVKGHRSPASSQSTHMALKRMGYGGKLDAHGMRSIASSYLNALGLNDNHVERCLAHEVGTKVHRTYNRSDYLEARMPIMQVWSDYITSCGQSSETNITPIRKQAV